MNERTATATIMVVDDTPENLTVLTEMLQHQGYRVQAFPGGAKALKAATARPPDLILLDIMMPEMNGFEVCEQLKADDTLKEIPVLFISALTEIADKIKAFAAGGVDYVTKPFQFEEIQARVHAHLEIRRQRRELQEALQQLQKLEQLRENLTHMIVHDMRSPLTVIVGSCEIIALEQDTLTSTQKKFLASGQKSCHDLTGMVDLLLDVSRLEAGQMPLDRVSCDILEIARGAVDSVTVQAREKSLVLSVTGDASKGVVDSDIIHRVIVNLLGNAIRFSPEGATIAVDVSAVEESVRVKVVDQGAGIPAKCHQRIFEKFYQVDTSVETKRSSSGLGLAFCKLAVEAHGGKIGVESAPDQGSAFWFNLPSDWRAGMKCKILIVDDDQHLLNVISELLKSTGLYEVRAVSDGMSAMTVACEFLPDIAILDIKMPDISGREIARQLSQNVLTRKVGVIFLTSLLQKAGQSSKKNVDGYPVLGKPVSQDELKLAIEDVMKKHNSNRFT